MTFKSINMLLYRLLGFKNLIVRHHDLQPRKGMLHLWVKPHKNGARCPQCQRRCKLISRARTSKGRRNRQWRDIPAGGLAVVLHYRPREISCPTHGRRQENIPWAAAKARSTLRLECLLLRLCKVMPQKEAAGELGIPDSTVCDMLHRIITRYRGNHRIRGLKNLGIDEISYKRRHCYLTIVYDLDRHCVVWAGVGKGRKTIDIFFEEVLSRGQKARVETACCDMSRAYMGAIEDHLPKAVLVLDRFHIVKAVNEAVDEVRRQRWRAVDAATRREFKGLRFILLKNCRNRTPSERRVLADLERADRRMFRACVLKDELSHFWTYTYLANAEKFLGKWCTKTLRSRIEPMRRFVHTLREHWDGVFASVTGITNAAAEGINRILRMTKNRASGFRSPGNYINLIFLVAGDLDIAAQIPNKNQPRPNKQIPLENLCF